MKNDFCLDTFMIEVIHMENVVWIFCVKIAFSYENDQNVFFFPICEYKRVFCFAVVRIDFD